MSERIDATPDENEPKGKQQPSRPVDPFRATRELERWLFGSVSEDQLRDLEDRYGPYGVKRGEAVISDEEIGQGYFTFYETIRDDSGNIQDITATYKRPEELTETERQELIALGYTALAAANQEEN